LVRDGPISPVILTSAEASSEGRPMSSAPRRFRPPAPGSGEGHGEEEAHEVDDTDTSSTASRSARPGSAGCCRHPGLHRRFRIEEHAGQQPAIMPSPAGDRHDGDVTVGDVREPWESTASTSGSSSRPQEADVTQTDLRLGAAARGEGVGDVVVRNATRGLGMSARAHSRSTTRGARALLRP